MHRYIMSMSGDVSVSRIISIHNSRAGFRAARGVRTLGGSGTRKNSRKLRSEPLWASESLKSAPRGLKTPSRALQEASRQLQERSKRPQDALKSAPIGFKTAPRALKGPEDALKSGPIGLKTAPRALKRLQDAISGAPRGFKTAPRALKRRQDALESAPRCLKSEGFLKSIFERSRGCSRSLNIKPTWIWGSTSPQVGVQKHLRRTCSFPLSSIQQASGRLAPCMAMHGSTLVLILY